jgi:hypothetical protein
MNYAKFFAGALLTVVAASASAADLNRTTTINLSDDTTFGHTFAAGNAGKTFLDIFNFTIDGTSSIGSSLTSKLSGGHDLDITSFGLYSGNSLIMAGRQESTGATESWSLDALAPAPGNYSLRVGGTVIGALKVAFTGDGYVTAVPEPETWTMLLGGLALVAFLARSKARAGRVAGGLTS